MMIRYQKKMLLKHFVLTWAILCGGVMLTTTVAQEDNSEDPTNQVKEAISELGVAIDEAVKRTDEVLAKLKQNLSSGNKLTEGTVRDTVSSLINQIRQRLGDLDATSKLSANTQELIILADEMAKNYREMDDDELANAWDKIKEVAETTRSQMNDEREKAYEQLTQIVLQENKIVGWLEVGLAKNAVESLQNVVEKLKNSQTAMKKWTDGILTQFTQRESSPQ